MIRILEENYYNICNKYNIPKILNSNKRDIEQLTEKEIIYFCTDLCKCIEDIIKMDKDLYSENDSKEDDIKKICEIEYNSNKKILHSGLDSKNESSSSLSNPKIEVCEFFEPIIDTDSNGNDIINDYKIVRLIGTGSFSKVYIGYNIYTKDIYAIKKIIYKKEDVLKQIKNTEIAIMKKINHRNIVKLYEVIYDMDEMTLYMIMQYISLGPILKIKKDNTCDRIKENICKLYIKQIISGLKYLHKHKIIHKDIKPDNILLDDKDNIYISDFGIAINMEKVNINSNMGTLLYTAPELFSLTNIVHNEATDIWAVGITLYLMIFGKFPFNGKNYYGIKNSIIHDDLEFPKEIKCSDECKDFLQKILNKDPKKRLNMIEIKKHNFIKKIKILEYKEKSLEFELLDISAISDSNMNNSDTDINYPQELEIKTAIIPKKPNKN